jgi:hypothetical protein
VCGATRVRERSREGRAYNAAHLHLRRAMSRIDELTDRVERLLLRHGELQRTNALLREQLAAVGQERDNLRSRLNAARARIDVLLERLPQDQPADEPLARTAP